MKIPTIRQAAVFLRRAIRILTPVALFFLVLSFAFEINDRWLADQVFGPPGRWVYDQSVERSAEYSCIVSFFALLLCGITAMVGEEAARRRFPIGWHAIANAATLFTAIYQSFPRLR